MEVLTFLINLKLFMHVQLNNWYLMSTNMAMYNSKATFAIH